MVMTFLPVAPQPGDGAWLLQQQQSGKRRGRGAKKLRTFLPEAAELYEQQHETFQYTGSTNQLPSFLPPSAFQPRTIPNVELLSTPPSQEQPYLGSFMPDLNTPEYVVDQHTIVDAQEDMAPPKVAPPHLRSKPASKPSASNAGSNVCEKLEALGVTVGESKPAPTVENPVFDDKENGKEEHVNGTKTTARDDDDAHPFRGRGAPTRRGNGRGGRDSRWPKNSDIPKPDPGRWVTNWDSEKSFGSAASIDSAQADSGFGQGKKKRASPNAGGFRLADWNGEWAPAPIDWDARPAFRHSTKVAQIEAWMEYIDEALCGKTHGISTEEIAAGDGCEVVPEYWIDFVFQVRQAPQTFWSEVVRSEEPMPLDKGDLDGAKPWWEMRKADTIFLQSYAQPSIKGIDPDENLNERIARENDHGAAQHAQNRRRTEKAKRDAQREKRQKAEDKARKFRESTAPANHRERIKPGLNLFVRSAHPADMVQVRDIYNHYVEFTCCTPENERRSSNDMAKRLSDIRRNHLPFLVACERGSKIKNRRRKHEVQEDLILPDKVIGFAYADDYNDITGMYRFTVEIEVYTDNQYYMKSVAKCLLDKLMAMLDPEYAERGGFDIQGEELEGIGPARVIHNIIINLPYDRPERLEWVGRWLTNWLQFEQKGVLSDVGNKSSKSVSLAIFQRKTDMVVDPANVPIPMCYPK